MNYLLLVNIYGYSDPHMVRYADPSNLSAGYLNRVPVYVYTVRRKGT